MAATDILCTHDLTAASDAAFACALKLADRSGARIALLHVVEDEEERGRAKAVLIDRAAKAGAADRTRVLLPEGDPMDRIAEESGKGYALVVLGTHGPRGLRQHLFGADILKLVRRLAVPALVVQASTNLEHGMDRIVLPVAAHENIGRLVDMVCALARLHAAEVHVFQLMRPGEVPSEELLRNKFLMLQRLQDDGVRHIEANVPSTTFSVGFAGPTIDYAASIGAGCIAIMAHASKEYRYIADAEKERLLTNDPGIAVLCA